MKAARNVVAEITKVYMMTVVLFVLGVGITLLLMAIPWFTRQNPATQVILINLFPMIVISIIALALFLGLPSMVYQWMQASVGELNTQLNAIR